MAEWHQKGEIYDSAPTFTVQDRKTTCVRVPSSKLRWRQKAQVIVTPCNGCNKIRLMNVVEHSQHIKMHDIIVSYHPIEGHRM